MIVVKAPRRTHLKEAEIKIRVESYYIDMNTEHVLNGTSLLLQTFG